MYIGLYCVAKDDGRTDLRTDPFTALIYELSFNRLKQISAAAPKEKISC